MPDDTDLLDLKNIKTFSLKDLKGKVKIADLGRPHKKGGSFASFLDSLPQTLAAKDLKEIISRIIKAHRSGKEVIFALGAHVIKVGLSPIIIDLMERGIITALAMNGAGIIHDFELAFCGMTSENVKDGLSEGRFGMARETGNHINQAINKGWTDGLGMGEAVGKFLLSSKLPNVKMSITATAYKLRIPLTVHIAVGTDTIHFHPSARGEALGKTSHRDFQKFSAIVSRLEGGIFLNIGSAVILPEVFLKALTLVRNLGYKLKKFTTVNMDFLEHYRPMVNVVKRPHVKGGWGYNLIGHHEIMLPLISAGIIEGTKE